LDLLCNELDKSAVPTHLRASYVASVLSDPSSELTMYLTAKAKEKFKSQYTTRSKARKTFYLPVWVPEKYRDRMRRAYPHLQLMFMETGYHLHGLAAAHRYVESYEMVLELAPKLKPGEVVHDVGGNYLPHILRGVYDVDGIEVLVHSSCPNLGRRDAMREANRLVTLETVVATTRDSALKNRVAALFAGDETYRCKCPAATCTANATLGMSLHSAYDIGVTGFADIMQTRSMREIVGTFIWNEDVRMMQSGDIEEMSMWFYKERDPSGSERVYMGFKDSSVYAYEHDMDVLESLTRPAVIKGKSGDYVYTVRFEGSVGRFRMRYVPLPRGTRLQPAVSQSYFYNERAEKYYELSTYAWDGKGRPALPSSYVPVTMLVERLMLDQFLSWARRIRSKDFTRAKLFGYLRSLREPFEINGRLFSPTQALDSHECVQLVDFVWLYTYRARYRTVMTTEKFCRRQDLRRDMYGASIITSIWCAVYAQLVSAAYSTQTTLAAVYDSFGAGALPCDYGEVDGVYYMPVSLVEAPVEVPATALTDEELLDTDVFFDCAEEIDSVEDCNSLGSDAGISDLGTENSDDSYGSFSEEMVGELGKCDCEPSTPVPTSIPPQTADYCLGARLRFSPEEKQMVLAAVAEAARVNSEEAKLVIPSVYQVFDTTYGSVPSPKPSDNKNYNVLSVYNGKVVNRLFPSDATYMGGIDIATRKFLRFGRMPKRTFRLFVTEDTEIMIKDKLAEVLESIARVPVEDFDRNIVLEEGVFGCGKTTYLVSVAAKTDLILVSTKATMREIRGKMLVKFPDYDVRNVRTFGSYLLHSGRCARVVHLDEALLEMAGTFWGAILLCRAQEIHCYADRHQIMWINRTRSLVTQFHRYYLFNEVYFTFVEHRCAADVAFSAALVYGRTVYTTRTQLRSMHLVRVKAESQVFHYMKYRALCDCRDGREKCDKRVVVLTFYRADKNQLAAGGVPSLCFEDGSSRYLTAHQSQGCTFGHVVLVRLNPIDKALEKDLAQVLVACTRHVKSFHYITRGASDEVTKFVARGAEASDEQLRSLVVSRGFKGRERVMTST